MHPNSRRVVFNTSVTVRETLHIENYTEREIRNSWYSAEDISRIKLEIRCTVSSYRRGRLDSLEHSSRYSLRGIEGFYNKTAAKARQLNKLIGLKSVLDEQERQDSLSVRDLEIISTKYQNDISQRCQRAAQIVGKQDEMVSQRIQKMDNKTNEKEKIGYTRIQLFLQQRELRKLSKAFNCDENSDSECMEDVNRLG